MPNTKSTHVFQYMHDAVGANCTDYARNRPSPPSPPHSSITITTSTTTTSSTVMHAHVSSSVYLLSQYASYIYVYTHFYIYIYICTHISMLLQTLYYHRWVFFFASPKSQLPEDNSQHNWFRPSGNVACRVGVYSHYNPCPLPTMLIQL